MARNMGEVLWFGDICFLCSSSAGNASASVADPHRDAHSRLGPAASRLKCFCLFSSYGPCTVTNKPKLVLRRENCSSTNLRPCDSYFRLNVETEVHVLVIDF